MEALQTRPIYQIRALVNAFLIVMETFIQKSISKIGYL